MAKKTYQAGIETKEKILKVSKNLFYEKGYEGTLYDDICKIAKVNRALIPYHFKNKGDLALTVYHNFMEQYNMILEQISKSCEDQVKLVFGIQLYFHLLQNWNVARFMNHIYTQDEFHKSLILDEEQLYEKVLQGQKKMSKSRFQAFIHLTFGMEMEVVEMIYMEKNNKVDVVIATMIHMIFEYMGYSITKINQLLKQGERILAQYNIEVNEDFCIVMEEEFEEKEIQ